MRRAIFLRLTSASPRREPYSWRRSWKRRPSTPARAHARWKASPTTWRSSLFPRWKYAGKGGEYEYEYADAPGFLLEPDEDEPDEDEEEIVVGGWKWIGEGKPPGPPPDEITRVVPKATLGGSQFDPFCLVHKRQKQKDGSRGSRQKYACPECRAHLPPVEEGAEPRFLMERERKSPECEDCGGYKRRTGTYKRADGKRVLYYNCPMPECVLKRRARNAEGRRLPASKRVPSDEARPHTPTEDVPTAGRPRPGSTPAAVATKLRKNPRCEGCGGLQRKRGKKRGGKGHYYQCVAQCGASRRTMPEPEELEKIVRAKVASLNGHHPQDRDDIVQEILLDLRVTKKLKFIDLEDRDRMRGYVYSQTRHSQDKFERPSLDAPLKADEEKGATFADNVISDEPTPLEELEAKEAVEARLREQAETEEHESDEELEDSAGE